MNDLPVDNTPAEEDPVFHRSFASLPTFAPRPGFENRVLAHVRRPPSPRVRQLLAVGRSLIETQRIWYMVGAYAGSTLLSLAVLTAIAAAHRAEAAALTGWLVSTLAVAWWRATQAYLAMLWSTITDFGAALVPAGMSPGAVAAAVLAALLLCALGLYSTLQSASRARTPHAKR